MNVRPTTYHGIAEQLAEYPGAVTVSGWKNLALHVWTGQATGPTVRALAESMDRMQRHAARSSHVHLVPDKLALPDAAARSGFAQIMKERHAELGCVAIVVGGTGFWASAMRNAIIGLRVFAPRNFEFRLHGTTDEVVAWLPQAHQQRTGVELPVEILQQLFTQLAETQP